MKKHKWGVKLGFFNYEYESDESLRRPISELGRQPLYDSLKDMEDRLVTAISNGDSPTAADALMRLAAEFGAPDERLRAADIHRELKESSGIPHGQRSQQRGEAFRGATELGGVICERVRQQLRAPRADTDPPIQPRHPKPRPRSGSGSRPKQEALIDVVGASFGFPGRTVLSDVDFCVSPGEIVGVVGQNAEGKSTLLRGLAGSLDPQIGEVTYPSLESEFVNRSVVLNQVLHVPQVPAAWPGTVETALRAYGALRGISRTPDSDQVPFLAEYWGLSSYLSYRYSELSVGYKTRFELAKAMMVKSRLLLLDEPLAPLDPPTRGAYLRKLRDLANSLTSPIGVVISAVDPVHISWIADRMLTVKDGSVSEWTDPSAGDSETRYEVVVAETSANLAQVLGSISGLRVDVDVIPNVVHAPLGATMRDIFGLLDREGLTVRLLQSDYRVSRDEGTRSG